MQDVNMGKEAFNFLFVGAGATWMYVAMKNQVPLKNRKLKKTWSLILLVLV